MTSFRRLRRKTLYFSNTGAVPGAVDRGTALVRRLLLAGTNLPETPEMRVGYRVSGSRAGTSVEKATNRRSRHS
jgi:hypothetical protein